VSVEGCFSPNPFADLIKCVTLCPKREGRHKVDEWIEVGVDGMLIEFQLK
jgi:hypothetical protein